jgi:hypothetical protein
MRLVGSEPEDLQDINAHLRGDRGSWRRAGKAPGASRNGDLARP